MLLYSLTFWIKLGANTTLWMTLFMRWVSESVLVGRCTARIVKTRIPRHKMFESGDRQEWRGLWE